MRQNEIFPSPFENLKIDGQAFIAPLLNFVFWSDCWNIFYFFHISFNKWLSTRCHPGLWYEWTRASSFLGAKHSMMGNGKGILNSIPPKEGYFSLPLQYITWQSLVGTGLSSFLLHWWRRLLLSHHPSSIWHRLGTTDRQPANRPSLYLTEESASFEARIIGRPNWPQLSHEYCTALQYQPDFSSNTA